MLESTTNPDAGGRLKVFLGYAPGVGKSYALLDESTRRKKRGQDIVIGSLDSHGRPAVDELLAEFEHIPKKKLDYRGTIIEEMDTDAILARRPEIVIIDDLAHTNAPGSLNEKRWQDVRDILDAGISVSTTMNVYSLESLNDLVNEITGVRITETVPDQILAAAEEVEMVDLTPRALIHRLERGDVIPNEKLDDSKSGMFKEGNLSALRELALREIAGRVDEDVQEFRKSKTIARPWAAKDRVMICISPTRPSMRLIRRGWRIAQRMHAEVVVVTVEDRAPNDKEKKIIQDDFSLAERLEIRTVTLKGPVSDSLIKYVKENAVTHVVIGHSERTRLQEVMQGSIISSLTRELRTIDILVVAADTEE